MEPAVRTDQPACGPAKRYTYPEAAEILRVKRAWLQENIRRLPHTKKGRTVTFSEADLDAIDAMFHHQPPQAVAPAPHLPAIPAGANPLALIKPARRARR
ncbi:helix-turn-helix domain-containing protein [Streptomyces nojiriensis]|uniref:helix-turn-helix domain-containing protein n=1 Tax=Streptomyces nojiriensis TaxID=66374 RepID=UPI003661D6AD